MNLSKDLKFSSDFSPKAFLDQGAFISLDEERVLVAWGALRQESEPVGSPAFFVTDYYLEQEKPWHHFEFSSLMTAESLRDQLSHWLNSKNLEKLPRRWKKHTSEQFFSLFHQVKEQMSLGTVSKMVPVIFEESEGRLSLQEKARVMRSLISHGNEKKIYGFWRENGTGLLGGTPEVLFHLEKKAMDKKTTLKTMALAGTHSLQKKDGSLIQDEKEWGEHQIVVEDLKKVLSVYGDHFWSETYEKKFANLKHLKTDGFCEWKSDWPSGSEIKGLVKNFHPTPALGVYPRSSMWLELQKWEANLGIQRGSYGAPFGLSFDPVGLSFLVAIRNIQWDNQKVVLGSGCGIVEKSQKETEWEELFLKRLSVKKMLGFKIDG